MLVMKKKKKKHAGEGEEQKAGSSSEERADRLKLNSFVFSDILHHPPDCRQKSLHLVLTCLQAKTTRSP